MATKTLQSTDDAQAEFAAVPIAAVEDLDTALAAKLQATGATGAAESPGDDVTLRGGTGGEVDGAGGNASLIGGAAPGGGNGGQASVAGGASVGGSGGPASIDGGATSNAAAAGGNVNIAGGSNGAAQPGSVSITGPDGNYGGGVAILGGNGVSAAPGGNVSLAAGTPDGLIILTGLPTADPVIAGALWLDTGVLKVSAG